MIPSSPLSAPTRQAGFVLLAVVVALVVVAAAALMLSMQTATDVENQQRLAEGLAADYLAEAAIEHASWQANQTSCTAYALPTTSFGADSYSATFSPAEGSPTTVTATATLASGVSRSLSRTGVRVYQSSTGSVVLQPGPSGQDTYVHDGSPATNFGAATEIRISNKSNSQKRGLLRFDLGSIPVGATVTSATLEMNLVGIGSGAVASVDVHRATTPWVESEADWNNASTADAWVTLGGDWDATAVDTATIDPLVLGATTWDLTTLVAGWVSGSYANDGMFLIGSFDVNHADFTTSDSADPSLWPKLTVDYAGCECGIVCQAPPASAGNLLFVVDNRVNPVPADVARQALFESWGFTVSLIAEEAGQNGFTAEFADNDVVYISSTVTDSTLGNKVVNAPIGVVTEQGEQSDELGFATGAAFTTGDTLTVVDNAHYITQPFDAGPLRIYDARMEGVTIAGTPSPDLADIGQWSGTTGLATLETGASMSGGGTTVNRRVLLPFGRNVNFGYVNNNGLLIIARALAWAKDASLGGTTGQNVLFVSGGETVMLYQDGDYAPTVVPTAHEQPIIDQIELFGFTVNLITHGDSQQNFDTAVAGNDAAYISADVSPTILGNKLLNPGIGLVNENAELVDELGFGASGSVWKSRDEIDVIDNSHYITSEFPTGLLTITSGLQPLYLMTATLGAGFVELGHAFNTGSLWDATLGTIEAGAALHGGGTAAGRRVQLPWSSASFDITSLTVDGGLLFRRALEWAAGDAAFVPDRVLFVAQDPAVLTVAEAETKSLLESWAYAVDLIDDDDTQASFDTAVGIADVAFISSDVIASALGTKLTDASIGVVVEEHQNWQELQLCSDRQPTSASAVEIADNTHYITSPFPTGPLTILTVAADTMFCTGAMAAGAVSLIESPGGGANPGLLTLDTGGIGLDGQPSAGRRVTTAWGGNWDPSKLNSEGQQLLQRSLEWAAGADLGGPIAHWTLDDAAGTTAIDSVGGHDGTLVNDGPVWVAGTSGGALEFDGVDDYVSVPYQPSLSFADQLTMMSWVSSHTTSGGYSAIVAQDVPGNGASNYWFGTWNDELVFGYWADGGFRTVQSAGLGISVDTWHHVAATFDNATNEVRLHMDGLEVAAGSIAWEPTTETADPWIGHSVDGEWWDGRLDDVRIYDRVLSAAEIAEIAAGAAGGGGGGGGACAATYADDFETGDYVGSTGTLVWSTDWLEINESDGSNRGDEAVHMDGTEALRVRDNDGGGEGVEREADLSGYASATLNLDYRRVALDDANDYVSVDVSGDGGANWHPLGTIAGAGHDDAYVPASYPIPADLLATNARIRFLSSPDLGNTDYVAFDNVEICLSQ